MLRRACLSSVTAARAVKLQTSVVLRPAETMMTRVYSSAPEKQLLNIRPEPDKVRLKLVGIEQAV